MYKINCCTMAWQANITAKQILCLCRLYISVMFTGRFRGLAPTKFYWHFYFSLVKAQFFTVIHSILFSKVIRCLLDTKLICTSLQICAGKIITTWKVLLFQSIYLQCWYIVSHRAADQFWQDFTEKNDTPLARKSCLSKIHGSNPAT